MTSKFMEDLLEKDLVHLKGGQAIGNAVGVPCRCPSGAGQSTSAGGGECICEKGGAGQQLIIDIPILPPGCTCVQGGARAN